MTSCHRDIWTSCPSPAGAIAEEQKPVTKKSGLIETPSVPTSKSWGRVFSCVSDGPFNLQVEEVAATEFMDVEAAFEINRSLVTPDTRQALLAYML